MIGDIQAPAAHQDSWHVRSSRIFINELVAQSKSWLVPEFQRHYVWSRENRIQLADSIIQGIPVGTIMLWSPEAWWGDHYILDGQQRITSLQRICDPDEPDQSFQIDVGVTPEHTIPFGTLAARSSNGIRRWLTDTGLYGSTAHPDVDRSVCHLYDVLSTYVINVVIIQGPEQFARSVYDRINTTGVPVDMTDRRLGGECPTIDELVTQMRTYRPRKIWR